MPAKKSTTKKQAPAQSAPATDPIPTTPAAVAQAAEPAAPDAPTVPDVTGDDASFDTELDNALGVAGDQRLDTDDADTPDDLPSDDTNLPSDTEDAAGTEDVTEEPAGEDSDDQPAQPETPDDDKVAKLEAQVAALTAKLEAAAQQPAAPRAFSSAEEEIAAAETEADLVRLQGKFQQLEDFATDHPEGAEFPPATPGSEPILYDAAQIRAIARNARAGLRAIPQQAAHLQRCASFDTLADKAYPDYAKPGSTLSRYYATLRQDPALRRLPYLKLIIGDAERGRLAREAAEKAAAGDGRPGTKVAPVARKPAPVLPTGGARRPAPVTSAQSKKAAAQKRLDASNGSLDDLAASIEADLD